MLRRNNKLPPKFHIKLKAWVSKKNLLSIIKPATRIQTHRQKNKLTSLKKLFNDAFKQSLSRVWAKVFQYCSQKDQQSNKLWSSNMEILSETLSLWKGSWTSLRLLFGLGSNLLMKNRLRESTREALNFIMPRESKISKFSSNKKNQKKLK